jgi:hypothetical protein
LSIRHDRRITLSGSVDHRWTGYGLSSVKSFIRRFVFDDFFLFSGRYETTESENGQGGVVLLSFLLHKLFAVQGDLMQNFFALSRSHQSSCSFAAMEISLPVFAKLPRCIRRPVPFERDRDFVGTNDVRLSRRRVKLFVVVESF